MKIAFFSNSYFPITYGSVVSVENFRVGLEDLGHEVHIFTPNFSGYSYEIDRIHLYPAFLFGYKIKYPIAVPSFGRLLREAETLDFDIIHAQHPFSICEEALKLAKKNKKPLVFTHHAKYEDYTHYVPPILPQKLIKSIVRKRVASFANKCDVCISPSETIKEYMRERDISAPIEVLPTGIAWKKFQEGKRDETRKRLKLKPENKVLMFLGRIENEKNILFMTKEVFPLLQKDHNLRFLFVGEGGLVEIIKQRAQRKGVLKQLIFTGLVQQKEVPDFYATTDVFLHTSLTETQGMTIAEAMAAGLPIVAIKASGVVDQLQNNKTGIMVEQDKGLFGAKVKEVLDNDVLASKLAKAAREKAKEYDNHNRAKQLEQIYKKLL